MKTVQKVRRIDENAGNTATNEKTDCQFKSIQILRKVKALKFEGTKQYKQYDELPKTDNNAEIA